jgi:alpha-beta hydrolase superfamily lysophospholipase
MVLWFIFNTKLMENNHFNSQDWPTKYEGLISTVGITYPEQDFIKLVSCHRQRLVTYRFNHENPKAIIFMFHGMHMSSSDFSHLSQILFQEGFTVAAFDQEGHGKSEGEKGTISSLEDLGKDSRAFIRKKKDLYRENLPAFIIGLSMGGALAVMTCLDEPGLVNGIILLGASLGVDPNFEPLLQKVVRCFNSCCCSRMRIKAIDQSLVSRHPHYQGYFHDHPEFFHGKLNVRTAVAMLNGFSRLQTRLSDFDAPFILFHGEADKLASVDQAKNFFKICKSSDKTINIYPDMFHVVTHEPEYPEIQRKILDWLNARII